MLKENEIIKMIFGFKVKYLRQQKKLSYQQLAEKTGLSTSYLHEIEKGKKYPKVDKIMLLAKALGSSYDFLVSTKASKKLQPVVDFLTSDFIKEFPLDFFGLGADKLFELFSNTPDRVNAFISTLFKVTRNYQMQREHFFLTALRSYQDMYDNHFPEIEEAVEAFKTEKKISGFGFPTQQLEDVLIHHYDVRIDRNLLPQKDELKKYRSYYSSPQKTLYLNENLSSAQQNFLIARELGFQYLELEPRPLLTRIADYSSFDKLLNNFKASYFAVALLMSEKELIHDIKNWSKETQWSADTLLSLIKKYKVTSEMLMQRLSNLLPTHFGLKDLFFLRLSSENGSDKYAMTKELHLSQIHQPYANESNEKYCRRWISTRLIQELREKGLPKETKYLADAQISNYWESPNSYLCFTIAKRDRRSPNQLVSVTIGLLITDQLKQQFRFLNDPSIKSLQVNTTCERCTMPNCESRAAPLRENFEKNGKQELEEVLKGIDAG